MELRGLPPSNTLVLVDADGQMVEAYAYGSELRPYAHFEGGATAYQYPNDFGMPAILDENGDVLHIDFSRTGLPAHIQPPTDVTAGSPYQSRYANPYLFNGRRWDAELGLYYYRNRHLDPIQGRFTTRDPIGIWGDPMNLGNGYAYVGNNPWTYVDPMGLEGGFSPLGALWNYITTPAGSDIEFNQVDYTRLTNVADSPDLQNVLWHDQLGEASRGHQALLEESTQRGVQLGVALAIDCGVGATAGAAVDLAADTGWLHWAGTPFRWAGRQCARLRRGADEAADTSRAVYHTVSSTGAAHGVLGGIDPRFFNPDSRFGRAFYLSDDAATTVAELAEHNFVGTQTIRFTLNENLANILDLTDPSVARAWGWYGQDGTELMGGAAVRAGYNVIKFPSLRGSGTNYAVLDDFTELLTAEGITPTP